MPKKEAVDVMQLLGIPKGNALISEHSGRGDGFLGEYCPRCYVLAAQI